jgi:hypothetical protein
MDFGETGLSKVAISLEKHAEAVGALGTSFENVGVVVGKSMERICGVIEEAAEKVVGLGYVFASILGLFVISNIVHQAIPDVPRACKSGSGKDV